MRLLLNRIPPLSLLMFVFAGYVVYPLGMVVAESLKADGTFSLRHYTELANAANAEAVWNSISVSLLSVLLSALAGTLLAVVVTQLNFPLKRFVSRVVILPIAMPPLVGVIAFLFVFGESGILPRVAHLAFGLDAALLALDGMSAIVAVHTYAFYVYFYLFVSTSLRSLDASQIEAAQILGSSLPRILIRVIVPAIRPALTGAAVLTFMASMASFSAPLIFGGEKRFMTMQIYNAKLNGEPDAASALAVVLTCISVIFFLLLKYVSAASNARAKGAAHQGFIPIGPTLRRVLLTTTAALVALELLPIVMILVISFAKEGSWTWQVFPSVFTAENYLKLLQDPRVFQPVGNSLLMSLLTLLATVIVGVTAAFLVTKGEFRRSRWVVDLIATLPFAIPGTVVALAMILAFNVPSFFTAYEVLVGTFWILPIAYAVRTFPMVVRSTASALEHVDDSLIEAGKILGAGVTMRLRKIVLPLIFPGIISGGLLVMITALGEFVSSILLYTYSNRPIAIEILAQMRSYNFGGAAAYSIFLLLLIYGLSWLASRFDDKQKHVAEYF